MRSEQIGDHEQNQTQKGPFFGKRHIQAILLFLLLTVEMMSRQSFSLSIVAMTDNSTSSNPNIPVYDWSNTNIIFSSFYWGYVILQIPAGHYSNVYSTKLMVLIAMILNSLITIAVPYAADIMESTGVMVCRIIQGLVQGAFLPSTHTLLGRWAPIEERGTISTFIFSGFFVGPIICFSITGVVSESYVGWPATFYIFGGCGFVWSIFWMIFGSDSPSKHSGITQKERHYIETSLDQVKDTETIPTPWKDMLLSIHFWAIFLPSIGCSYAILFFQTEFPTYLQKALKFDVSSSGYLSSMTAAVTVLATFICGPVSDFLIGRNILSTINTRKLFECLACLGSGSVMLGIAFLNGSQSTIAVVLLTISSFLSAAQFLGHQINMIDLTPRFAGVVMAVTNAISSFLALAAPLSVQWFVTDETDVKQWRVVFIIAAVCFTVSAIVFVLFASAERQWWDGGSEGKVVDVEKTNIRAKKISVVEMSVK